MTTFLRGSRWAAAVAAVLATSLVGGAAQAALGYDEALRLAQAFKGPNSPLAGEPSCAPGVPACADEYGAALMSLQTVP